MWIVVGAWLLANALLSLLLLLEWMDPLHAIVAGVLAYGVVAALFVARALREAEPSWRRAQPRAGALRASEPTGLSAGHPRLLRALRALRVKLPGG